MIEDCWIVPSVYRKLPTFFERSSFAYSFLLVEGSIAVGWSYCGSTRTFDSSYKLSGRHWEKESWIANVNGFVSYWRWRWSRLFCVVLISSITLLAMVMQIVQFYWMIMMNYYKLINTIILWLYWVCLVYSLYCIGTIQNAAKEFQASIEESKVGMMKSLKDRPPFKISVI